jgi:glycine C-acetyltransferase/8-amino-7-oxononanoate synthase
MGTEDACYLVTGYAGNFALAAALRADVDVAFIDDSVHDCLSEATRWLDLQEPPIRFRHRDATHLAELLQREVKTGQRPLVMTDGVFAASGRLAPLADYHHLLASYPGAKLLVDDAHGVGVLGPQGRGSLELAGVPSTAINRADVNTDASSQGVSVFQSLTLSKAIGGHGGALVGSREFLDRVRSASGWFRGSSAPAAPVAAATAKALEIVQARPELRQTLAGNVAYARQQLRGLGLGVEDLPTAIISIELSTAAEMQRVQRGMLAEGVAIAHSRDYAGAGPDGMLRIAIFATHTREMIDQLVATMQRVL